MRHLFLALIAAMSLVTKSDAIQAADCCCEKPACNPCSDGVPTCKSSWDEKKTQKTKYTMKCEPACARAAECFCTGPAECRCSPPCGSIYTKKKLYKQPGEEQVEKVPKYEVKMVPAEPCDCARCSGVCWWNPLSVLHYLVGH